MDKIRILIVDDDKNFRLLLNNYFFAKKDNFQVIGHASNGKDAIKKAEQLHPDLIIMDVRMPIMNGLEATKRIKEKMPWIKIIILSFYDLLEYQKAAIESGANGYVLKKSMINHLIPTINKALNITVKSTQPDHN